MSSDIQHNELPCFQEPHIQATIISIIIKNITIKIASTYCPPRYKIDTNDFNRFFQLLGHSFIAGGDFNSKHFLWGSRAPNQRGSALHRSLIENRLSFISPSDPTYWPAHANRLPETLDFFISKIPNHINTNIENMCDLSSDHSPILLSIAGDIIRNSRPSLTNGPVDWVKFRQILDQTINLRISLKSCSDIDIAAKCIVQTIQQSATIATLPVKPRQPNPSSNLPSDIKQLIINKRRARSIWQSTRLPSHKKNLNYLTNLLKTKLRVHKSEQFELYMKSLQPKNGSLWKATKKLTKYREKIPPLRQENGLLAITDKDKANIFASQLAETFKPHPLTTPENNFNSEMHNFLSAPLPMSLPSKPISPGEIQSLINKLPPGKAPGNDLITNKVLKNLSLKTLMLLTHIYNAMLRLSHFPEIWKFAVILLIPKPNKPKHLSTSYRPISLLPVLGKLFEKTLLKRLRPILQESHIFPNNQFGFRNRHSTIHQVHRLTDEISTALENQHYCSGLFLDIAQAFDKVWHEGLLYKLKLYMPAPYYLILKAYLQNRSFVVRQGNDLSSTHQIYAGVPQGSDLSPDLYNLFTADIPQSNNTLLATYADDTAILATGANPNQVTEILQTQVDRIDSWAKQWRIKINTDKSVQVTFTLKRSPEECPQLIMNNIPIPVRTQIKYLGITLDKKLTWGPHLKEKRKSVNNRLHLLRPLLNSKISLQNKLIIYKTIIRPVWSYGIAIWGPAKPSNIRPIQAFQSISLRLITHAPWYVSNLSLHNDLKITTTTELAKTTYKRFHQNLNTHTNTLINQMSTVTLPKNPPRRLKRKWCRDLLN